MFNVEKAGRGRLVSGSITVDRKIDAETYRRAVGAKKEAEANAAKMTQTETEARAYVAEVKAARKA